jgi:hypothetical protein
MAGRRTAAAWPAGAVRVVGDRRDHRRGSVRFHVAQRHHYDPGRCGGHRHVDRSSACGVGASPSTTGAAGPPTGHDCGGAEARAALSGTADAGTRHAATACTRDNGTDDHDANDDDNDLDDYGSDASPTAAAFAADVAEPPAD